MAGRSGRRLRPPEILGIAACVQSEKESQIEGRTAQLPLEGRLLSYGAGGARERQEEGKTTTELVSLR